MSKPRIKRDDAEPPKIVAKKELVRLAALDLAMSNLVAFCALLKDLNARLVGDEPVVQEPHAYAIRMVRAGILRAAIGTVMACLDPADQKRGNRASVGEIFSLLDGVTAIQQLRKFHKTLRGILCSRA